MKLTTRIKITIKKYLPNSLFGVIRKIYDATFLKIMPLLFTFRIRNFKKEKIVDLSYFGHSFSILIDPKNGFLDAQIYLYKKYEVHILKEILNQVHTGDTVLDIGANIGHHSLFMSRLVGDNGKVIAFEPIPYIREQFEKSIAINNITNIKIEPIALGDKESIGAIHINESNVAGSSLVSVPSSDKDQTIRIVTLDSLNLSPSFMKIDVEGYEYFALLGGDNTISQYHPTILLEYSPIYYRTSNPSHTQDIISFLRKHNYDIYDLEDGRKKVANDKEFISSFAEGLRGQTNIICIPR